MLQSEQDSLVTPGAAWPKFRAPFCVTGGRQAHWAQREQGRAVHEIVHSYIYSKEGYLQQPLSPADLLWRPVCSLWSLERGQSYFVSGDTHRLKFVLICSFISSFQWICMTMLALEKAKQDVKMELLSVQNQCKPIPAFSICICCINNCILNCGLRVFWTMAFKLPSSDNNCAVCSIYS